MPPMGRLISSGFVQSTLVLLIAVLGSCGSQTCHRSSEGEQDTELHGPKPNDSQVQSIVDELAGSEVKAWAEKVKALDAPLRWAVNAELGNRTIALLEDWKSLQLMVLLQEWQSKREDGDKVPKELEAIRVILEGSGGRLEGLTDYMVFAGAHMGHEGFDNVWLIGVKAFPSILKLRRDKHYAEQWYVGKFLVEYVLGSFRGREHSDDKIVEFCQEELTRCPAELRPHYKAILAALGDESCLDAIPTLLKSDAPADWIFGHDLIEKMFAFAPYWPGQLDSIRTVDTSRERASGLWSALNEKTLAWWSKNRSRMIYVKKAGVWRLP